MPLRLIPRDEGFFERFAQLATHIGEAAALLHELFRDPARAPEIAPRIKSIEQQGDQIAHDINLRIDTSFVTPLDREDIHLLANRLDNVIDLMNGAARRAVIFNVKAPRAGAPEMCSVLERAAAEIDASVRDIRKRGKMLEHGRAMKLLEEEGDQRYGEAITSLFSAATDPLDVIRWKDIFDNLEAAIDECEDVVNVLESISLKNS